MSAPRAAAQLFRCQRRAVIRSARYAGGDGATRRPYHRAEHIQRHGWKTEQSTRHGVSWTFRDRFSM